MAEATPSDVEGVIDTSLDSGEVQSYIDDAEFEAKQEIDNYATSLTAEERRQLEKYLAALRIATTKDRRASQSAVGDSSLTYEASTVSALRKQVERRDPSDSLARDVDDDRYVTSTR